MYRSLINIVLVASFLATVGMLPYGSASIEEEQSSPLSGVAYAQGSLPALPNNWPSTLQIGRTSGANGAASMKALAPFGFRYQYLSAGVNTGNGWATWNSPSGQFVTYYIQDSVANGVTPVFTYYMIFQSLPASGGNEQQKVLNNLQNASTMQAYWNDMKLFFQKAGAFPNNRVVFHVEPDMWGFGQQAATGDNAATVPVKVAGSGVSDLSGLPDNMAGFGQAVVRLRNTYAPNVVLGYHVSIWGTGVDISISDPSDTQVDALATRAANFYNSLNASFDVSFGEFSDRDSEFKIAQYGAGQDAWWDANDFRRHVNFIKKFVAVSGKRMVLWQIPFGNTKMRAVNNTWNHYQDNRAEWLLDSPADRTHLTEYINAGAIAFLFGRGAGGATDASDANGDGTTNPAPINGNTTSSYSADDDGGYFHNRAKAYYDTGAMSLSGGSNPPPATSTPTSTATSTSTTAPAATATSTNVPATSTPTRTPTQPAAATSTPTRTPTQPAGSTATPTPPGGAVLTPTPTRTPTGAAATSTATAVPNTFTTSASAAPSSVNVGGTTAITASVTSGSASSVVVDVEVYSPSDAKVYQQYFENQTFTAGQQRTFPVNWTVPNGTAPGQYRVKIGIFANGSPNWGQMYTWNNNAGSVTVAVAPTATPTMTSTPVPVRSCTNPQFSQISPASPQQVGSTVAVTASATANNGATCEYRFWRMDTNGAWSMVRDWSTNTSYTYAPLGNTVGTYKLGIWTRHQGVDPPQGYTTTSGTTLMVDYTLTAAPSCTAPKFTQVSPASPQQVGTTVAVTASATANNGATCEFRFWRMDPNGTWTMVRDWSTTPTYSYSPLSNTAGAYKLGIWTRHQGVDPPGGYTTTTGNTLTVDYTVTPPPPGSCTNPQFTQVNPASPQAAGTSVSVTASATPSAGGVTCEYRFWRMAPNGTWSMVRDWSTNASYTFSPVGTTAGTYKLGIWSRAQGVDPPQGYTTTSGTTLMVDYTLTAASCTNPQFSQVNPASPEPVGASVNVTASATATSGVTCEYRFWRMDPSGAWTMVRDWTTNASYTYTPLGIVPGTYKLGIWTRAQGVDPPQGYSTTSGTTLMMDYTLTPASCTNPQLAASPTSPRQVGTNVLATASATATGGVTCEYRFWRQDTNGVWTLVRDWSTNASYTYTPLGNTPGAYRLGVWTRAQGVDPPQGYSTTTGNTLMVDYSLTP